ATKRRHPRFGKARMYDRLKFVDTRKKQKGTIMKLLISAIASVVFLTGCAAKQENSNTGNSSATANQAAAGNAEKPTHGSSTSVTNDGAKTDGNPVEFTCLGLSADKTHFSYRVKINTDKPISQVDIEVKS